MNSIDFAAIPNIGWITILVISILVFIVLAALIVGLVIVILKKNIKTTFFESTEIKPEIKERYIAEGKDIIDNQSQVAKLMLKGGRMKVFELGIEMFNITDPKEKIIFELITYRIADRLNYELKNDFTRNHITNKTDYELDQYSTSKSKAYYSLIKERLFVFNDKLPKYHLPKIMTMIPYSEVNELFRDIYYSARGIVGYTNTKQLEENNEQKH